MSVTTYRESKKSTQAAATTLSLIFGAKAEFAGDDTPLLSMELGTPWL